jgi:serine/threonine protein kinase
MRTREKRQTHGTVAYMAPEVKDGKAPSMQSDVYALGLIAWRMINKDSKVDGTAVVKKPEFIRAHGLSLREAAMLNRTLAEVAENRPRTAYEVYRLFRESEQMRVA